MILNNLKKFFFKRKKNNTRNINDILNNIIKISYSSSFNKKFKIPKTFYSRYKTKKWKSKQDEGSNNV